MRRVGGLAIADRRTGSGRPVVFVHGLGVSSRYFIPTMRQLAGRYGCRAVDLPGFGLSENPPHPLDVSGLADSLAAWLRVNDLATAALVGNSAGCQYIVDCAARHVDVTGPVVLIGATTDPAARSAPAQIGRWLRTGLHEDITLVPVLVRDGAAAGPRRILATFRSMLDDAMEPKLRSVRQPVLVMRGSSDHIAPRTWSERMAGLLPHARLVEIAGGAHVVNFTHPVEVAREIDRFLRDHVEAMA